MKNKLLINLFLLFVLVFTTKHITAQTNYAHHREVCIMPSEVKESSGLVIVSPNIIWTHGDSGNENKIFKVDSNGILLRTITIENAPNIDWEDMAIDANGDLWICDGGNNSNARQDLKILKVSNPELHDSTSVNAQIINYSFPDQTAFPPPSSNRNFDVEGLVRYKDSLLLFTKDRSSPVTGYTKLYRLPILPGTYVADLVDSFYMGSSNQLARVTAADMHIETGRIALLTLAQIVVFSNYIGSDFFGGDITHYRFKNPTNQVEALSFIDSNRFYMTDEIPGAWYEVILEESPNNASVSNVQVRNIVTVYPNPNNSFLTVRPSNGHAVQFLSIVDVNGRVVMESTETTLDISSLNNGVYFVMTMVDGVTYRNKVVLNK